MKNKFFVIFLISALIFAVSCQVTKQVMETLTDIKKLQFRLESVNNFKLAGVPLADKTSLQNFSVTDGLKLANTFAKNTLPAEFVLNVEVKNPNDGKSGSRKINATITSLDWRLIIDDVPTISGIINKPIEVPGDGYLTYIPIDIKVDLFEFFKNRSYEGIVNLALAIGGARGSTAKLKLDVQPTVSTPLGPITYPSRITVIDKTFN